MRELCPCDLSLSQGFHAIYPTEVREWSEKGGSMPVTVLVNPQLNQGYTEEELEYLQTAKHTSNKSTEKYNTAKFNQKNVE